jgi:hypothetical protein
MLLWIPFLVSIAIADPEVVTITEGERAPFTGTLMNPEAVARVLVDSDMSLEQCRIESQRDLALQEARLDLRYRNKEAEFAACTLRSVELDALRTEHIEFLEKQVVAPKWQPILYFVGGVLTGAMTIYGSSVILNNIGGQR